MLVALLLLEGMWGGTEGQWRGRQSGQTYRQVAGGLLRAPFMLPPDCFVKYTHCGPGELRVWEVQGGDRLSK